MTDDIRQAIALLRHQIISPMLMQSDQARIGYFRKLSEQEFNVPGGSKTRFSAWTMESWFKKYRKHGFKGITPKVRSDRGQGRKLSEKNRAGIIEMRRELMDMKISPFYRRVKTAGLLGEGICQETLRRFLESEKLSTESSPKEPRKRYEMGYFGELWVGDFMHGPNLLAGMRGAKEIKKKAILLGIIDDHSRLMVGHRWAFMETTAAIESVFKESILIYGKPDRFYCDNGPSFSSEYLRLVCAHLGIGLVHSKPYDSPSRGKIERFFRTVREDFLIDSKAKTLEQINTDFSVWIREYHQRHHHGIDCRPIDRYQRSIHDYPRARVDENVLEEFFMARITRRVKKDATISFDKLIYEVPARCIGKVIDVRYRQDRPREIFLYEGDKLSTPLKVVDSRANGKFYKPRERDTVISYQEKKK